MKNVKWMHFLLLIIGLYLISGDDILHAVQGGVILLFTVIDYWGQVITDKLFEMKVGTKEGE